MACELEAQASVLESDSEDSMMAQVAYRFTFIDILLEDGGWGGEGGGRDLNDLAGETLS